MRGLFFEYVFDTIDGMPTTSSAQPPAVAVQAAAELAGVEWSQVDEAALLEAAAGLARLKAVTEGALVAVAERLAATGAAEVAGWASVTDFLTHLTGGRKGAGAGLMRVAEHTVELPAVRRAMADGEVSLAQAGVIAGRVRALPRECALPERVADRMLALVATHGYDATDLDRTFADVVREVDTDGSLLNADLDKPRQERGAQRARFLSLAPDTLGGVRIKGYASLEEAELVKVTLLPLAAPITTEPGACGGTPSRGRDLETRRRNRQGCPDPDCFHDGRDVRDHGARLWDALVETCRRLQDSDTLPLAHGASARITVTTRLEDLRITLDRAGTDGLLGTGESLSATAVRRIACDAEIIPAVLGSTGQILDVGRASRLVTPGIWTALVLRDRHCAFPGCDRLPIACDAHHIVHWADGGPTTLDNLLLLCRRHHTAIHHTSWQVHIDPDTRQPVWTPRRTIDDTGRFTYVPARGRPRFVA